MHLTLAQDEPKLEEQLGFTHPLTSERLQVAVRIHL